MVSGEEVDHQITEEEEIHDASDHRPRRVVIVGEGKPPRCRDTDEEDEECDDEVPHGLERIFGQNDEVIVLLLGRYA